MEFYLPVRQRPRGIRTRTGGISNIVCIRPCGILCGERFPNRDKAAGGGIGHTVVIFETKDAPAHRRRRYATIGGSHISHIRKWNRAAAAENIVSRVEYCEVILCGRCSKTACRQTKCSTTTCSRKDHRESHVGVTGHRAGIRRRLNPCRERRSRYVQSIRLHKGLRQLIQQRIFVGVIEGHIAGSCSTHAASWRNIRLERKFRRIRRGGASG